MKLLPLAAFLMALLLTSCQRHSVDEEGVRAWALSEGVVKRERSAVYTAQQDSGTNVYLCTAEMQEHTKGVQYNGGEVLAQGFYVYPGGQKVADVEEAIEVMKKTRGLSVE